ncbi:hypothetical protein VNO80_28485 [Phaseolus coccineus]|uniref:Uncharacterized protein n=1 Tax=Phaseolus coccineus TaxID=3886 RepID=A0AAN9LBL4_PHACN
MKDRTPLKCMKCIYKEESEEFVINMLEAKPHSRKLVAATLPNMGNSPVPVIYPPFPPITDWPEYRLPSPFIPTLPPFSPVPPTLPPFSPVPPTLPPFSPVPPTITNP